jgi:hypothetical protein
MSTKSVPLLTPEDQATECLLAAIESAIGGIQQRLADLPADGPDAKWSVSDLVRLLQLRNQLQEERPRTIFAYWVDDPRDSNQSINDNNNED